MRPSGDADVVLNSLYALGWVKQGYAYEFPILEPVKCAIAPHIDE